MRKTFASIAVISSILSASPAFAAGNVEVSLKAPRTITFSQNRQTVGTLHFETTGGQVDIRELPIVLEWKGAAKGAKVALKSFDIRNAVTGRTLDLRIVPDKSSATSVFSVGDDFVVDDGDEWAVRMQAGKELKGASVRLRVITRSPSDPSCKTKSAADPCNVKTDAKAEMLLNGETAEVLPAKGVDGRWVKLR